MTEKDKLMAERRDSRDSSGHIPAPKPKWGSYAEFRLKELETERKLFNVNHLGYYGGGVPNKGLMKIRGTSWNAPG